jgi:hypothetical protein
MDRICEIVVIPDVVANVYALAAARAYAAVLGAEGRAAKRIGPTMAQDLGSTPQIRSGGIQQGPVGPGQSGHQSAVTARGYSPNWRSDWYTPTSTSVSTVSKMRAP